MNTVNTVVIIDINIDFLNILTIHLVNIMLQKLWGFIMSIELKITVVTVAGILTTLMSYALIALHA